MLQISKENLQAEAKSRGYRVEILEKVYRLLDLLEQFKAIRYLDERLALKGGTAINLFCTEQLPRLSVDIDFNYIGSVSRNTMQQEKLALEEILIDTCSRLKYALLRSPRAHAGGKKVFEYASVLGNKGRLEIDLNYIFRVPLWNVSLRSSPEWPKPVSVSVLDIHELAAGKLHALLGREASRDLFDSHQLLTKWPLDFKKLKLAFTVYAGMERDSWQRISTDNIRFTVKDIRDKLIPVLRNDIVPGTSFQTIEAWANQLVNECKTAFSSVLPFDKHEIEFLERLQLQGEIQPELISDDKDFCHRVARHPSLLWRAQQVSK